MQAATTVVTAPYKVVSWLFKRKGHKPTPEEKLEKKLRPYQNYLFKLQELLIWKNPYESLQCLVLIHILFFFLAWTKWRFYGVVIWMVLVIVLYEAWVDRIWPEIRAETPKPPSSELSLTQQAPPEGMLSVPELSKCATSVHSIATSIFIYLKALRANHPLMFCCIMASMLLVVAQVGSAVSGFWLLYLVVMCTILAPGILFHFSSPKSREWISGILTNFASFLQPKDSETDVDDYLPEQNKENLSLFNLASGDIVASTNVSTPSSDTDVLPLEPIPSYDESSVDHDYSLMGVDAAALESAIQITESSLNFTPTHFNGSTLSAALRKALVDTLGPNLVAAVSSNPPIHERSDSEHSDSSEFELIDPEEDSPPT